MPLFWLALLLQIFAVRFVPSLPINGQVSPGILSGRAWLVETGVFESKPTHFLILDAALNGDGEIFWNAIQHLILPALTLTYGFVGLIFAGLLGGVVLVEDVFVWNGIGRWATVAIISHDLAAILGTTLIFALFLVLANLVVDIIYAYLDPRITL